VFMCGGRLFGFAHDFDDAVVLDGAVVALADEAVEVGAVGGVGEGGIPELVFAADVVDLVDEAAPAVVDVEFVVGVAAVFEQVADAEEVVVAVVVGGDEVGELEVGGDYLDGVGDGVGAGEGVAVEADVVLREDEPHVVVGGEFDVGDVPAVGGVGDGGGVEVVGGVGLFFEEPEGGGGGVEGDGGVVE